MITPAVGVALQCKMKNGSHLKSEITNRKAGLGNTKRSMEPGQRRRSIWPRKNQSNWAASQADHKALSVQKSYEKTRTHGLSLPPVTMSPSRRVVYMANTGPVCALATTRHSTWSFHTHTSPLMVPVNVKLLWKGVRKINSSTVQTEFKHAIL